MKRFLILLTLAAFAICAPLAMAQTETPGSPKAATDKPAKTVNCCVKKECKQVGSEADCAKDGGKVVKDCKECK